MAGGPVLDSADTEHSRYRERVYRTALPTWADGTWRPREGTQPGTWGLAWALPHGVLLWRLRLIAHGSAPPAFLPPALSTCPQLLPCPSCAQMPVRTGQVWGERWPRVLRASPGGGGGPGSCGHRLGEEVTPGPAGIAWGERWPRVLRASPGGRGGPGSCGHRLEGEVALGPAGIAWGGEVAPGPVGIAWRERWPWVLRGSPGGGGGPGSCGHRL